MYNSVYNDDTDFKVCGFFKNTNMQISWKRNTIFPTNKKNYSLYIYTFITIIFQKIVF